MTTNRSRRVWIAAVGAGVLSVAGGGAAIAATQASPSADAQAAVIDDAAQQLGVEPSELSAALQKALEARVDAAVAAGRLTEEQGKALKTRFGPGGRPFLFGGFGFRGFRGFSHARPFARLDAAYSYLGLTPAELRTQLGSGKTLAEVAKARGKPVEGLINSLIKDAERKLDAAVADGRLTKAQADAIKAGLETELTDLVNGEHGLRHRFGFRGFRGFDHAGPGFHKAAQPSG